MVMFSAVSFLILLVIVVLIMGMVTKKWNKILYLISGLFFLVAIIMIAPANTIQVPMFNNSLKNTLIFFALGFLTLSINEFIKKK